MGLNINTDMAPAGNFLAVAKYDARAGRVFRSDRTPDGVTENIDITMIGDTKFSAIMDLAHVEIGWLMFARGAAPIMALVPLGEPMPTRPHEEAKQGFRIVMKLSTKAADGQDQIRELAGSSKALVASISKLHDDYLIGLVAHPGKLPVVTLDETKAVESGSGANRSKNYAPIWTISGWVARPKDLVHSPRTVAPAAAPAARAPATGSRIAPPPAAAVGADDFG